MIRRPPLTPLKKASFVSLKEMVTKIPPGLRWQSRISPAFWTVASVVSLSVYLILMISLVFLGANYE
jgi:hypothetical protein